jgi:hypothetical protein
MNFQFAFLAQFESPVVPLKNICQEFLGITPKTAEQKASACALPFPTFKTRGSERAPTMVKVSDLATYVEAQYEAGKAEWQSVQPH